MLRLTKPLLGVALLAGLAAAAPIPSAQADPVLPEHGHWVHAAHDGRTGWWWAGPGFWYAFPAPVSIFYADGPPPADYVGPAVPTSDPVWYYCDSVKSYYPFVQTCSGGWQSVTVSPKPPHPDGKTSASHAPAPASTTKS